MFSFEIKNVIFSQWRILICFIAFVDTLEIVDAKGEVELMWRVADANVSLDFCLY